MSRRELGWAIGGMMLLTAVWLAPVLFPPDGQALGGLDSRSQFYLWLDFARTAVFDGRLPTWNASLFAGYPFLADPQVAFFYPITWLLLLLPPRLAISWHVLIHIVIAGVGMYVLVRSLDGHPLGAVLAALTFAFSGFVAARIYAGHIGFLATNSWLPLLLAATLWAVQRRSVWTAVLAGVPFGMAILAGNPTSLLYTAVIWGFFVVWLAVWGSETNTKSMKDTKSTKVFFVLRQFLIAVGVGVLLSGVQLLPFLQFSALSTRAAEPTFEFAAAFSFPPAHLITLLVPQFFGEPTQIGYWSVPNFEELTYYAGVLPLLGLILVWKRPSRLAYFCLFLIIFGVLLGFGGYGFLFGWVYEALPPFRLVRAPGRALFLYTFGAALLLGEMVTMWLRSEDRTEAAARWLRWVLVGTAVLGLTTIAATGAVFAAVHPTENSGRLWHQINGWGLAIGLLFVGGVLLWQLFKSELPKRWVGIALATLVVVDLWIFGSKFALLNSTAPAPLWVDAAQVVGEGDGRILPWGISIFDQNGAAQVGLDSVFGYNPLELGASTAFAASIPDPRSAAYDILGASHVVSQVVLEQYGDGERPLTLQAQQGGTQIYQRGQVLPLARLVYGFELISDDGAAVARVHAPDFDPAETVILPNEPSCAITEANDGGSASIVERSDGYWRIQTRSSVPALLVVSETAYPGWQVWIDGEVAEWQRAYTAVRAVCVPAGEHEIIWRFQPTIFWWGGLLSLLGLVLVGTAVFQEQKM